MNRRKNRRKRTIMTEAFPVIAAALSAGICIWSKYRGFTNFHYIFKPLTMLIIIALAISAMVSGGPTMYRLLILAGLFFSIAGDVFLMIPGDKFLAGLLAFLLAHIAYTTAFVFGKGFGFTPWLASIFALIWIVIFIVIVPYTERNMKLPVIIYMLVIVVMVWQAWERTVSMGSGLSVIAAVGAVFFLVSDGMLGFNRFRKPFHSADFLVLSTYFTAQYLIAYSMG
jgi:uncharacterized membrane protein YhhN